MRPTSSGLPGQTEIERLRRMPVRARMSRAEGNQGSPAGVRKPTSPSRLPTSAPISTRSPRAAAVAGYKCKEGQGDANDYAAVVYLFAADLTLEQPEGPTAGNVSGELASAPSVAGTSDVAFSASDPGSGVYEAVFTVDGQRAAAHACSTKTAAAAGTWADERRAAGVPLRAAVPGVGEQRRGVRHDAARNGAHHLLVSVIDAAGNSAPVLDRNVIVANPCRRGRRRRRGAGDGDRSPNGTPAPTGDAAVAWKGSHSARLTSAFGRAHVVDRAADRARRRADRRRADRRARDPGLRGRAGGGDGEPAHGGGRPLHAARAGRVLLAHAALRLPHPSRRRAARRHAHAGAQRARGHRGCRSRRGRRAWAGGSSSAGACSAGPIPQRRKLLVLEARSPGGAWIEFNVVRSDRRGRYRASYRFRFPGPPTTGSGCVSEPEADYPFATRRVEPGGGARALRRPRRAV